MFASVIWLLLLFSMVPIAMLAEQPKFFPAFVWAIIGMMLAFLLGQASITMF